jgi:uncharacterized protein
MILYLHGFGSSAFSAKVSKLQSMPFDEPFLAPSLSTIPDLAIKTLEDMIELYLQSNDPQLSTVNLMGSSLGGYYALHLSQKYQLKAVLINPSIQPYKTLSRFQSMTSYYDNSAFEWNERHIESLYDYETNRIPTPKDILLLTQKGDESLDYRVAVNKLQGSKQIIEEGGNHSFENIEAHFQTIKDFFKP